MTLKLKLLIEILQKYKNFQTKHQCSHATAMDDQLLGRPQRLPKVKC